MSVLITDKDGVEVEVFLEETGGMIDVMLRAETETDWIEGACFYGLLLTGYTDETVEVVEPVLIGSVVVPFADLPRLDDYDPERDGYDIDWDEVMTPKFDKPYGLSRYVIEGDEQKPDLRYEFLTAGEYKTMRNHYLYAAPGVEIDAIGSVIVTPGTYDEAGVEITPPVIDSRYHVNLRLHGVVLEKFAQGDESEHKWKQMARNWATLGIDDPKPNKDERGKQLARVTSIDPATIKTRMRVYL